MQIASITALFAPTRQCPTTLPSSTSSTSSNTQEYIPSITRAPTSAQSGTPKHNQTSKLSALQLWSASAPALPAVPTSLCPGQIKTRSFVYNKTHNDCNPTLPAILHCYHLGRLHNHSKQNIHISTTSPTIFSATKFIVAVLAGHIVLSTNLRAVQSCTSLYIANFYKSSY